MYFSPADGFAGFEEFSYTAQDAGIAGGTSTPSVDQDTARVVVNVLEDLVPDAVDDDVTVLQSTYVFIDVLANDTFGNEPHTLEIVTPPANGSAFIQTDDTIRYYSYYNFFGEDSFEYRITDANGDSSTATVTVGVFFRQGVVPIDIMPKDAGNNFNLRSGPGAGFEIAILSVGEFFDAPSQINPLSLKFGPRQANIWGTPRIRNVDGDGYDDLIVKFLTQQTGIACGDTSASLYGRTFENYSISGSDSINTFNCPRVRKRH
ncbi:MAG: cadherin-like domain-containing protein [Myxococcales bacterium]|nr:cadherin-like domain-containing protein [Myxococcales bacterium]